MAGDDNSRRYRESVAEMESKGVVAVAPGAGGGTYPRWWRFVDFAKDNTATTT